MPYLIANVGVKCQKFIFLRMWERKTLSQFSLGYDGSVELNMVIFKCFKVQKNNKMVR